MRFEIQKHTDLHTDARQTDAPVLSASPVDDLVAQLEEDIRQYRRLRRRATLRSIVRYAIVIGIVVFVFHRAWGHLWWLLMIFGGSKMTDAQARRRARAAKALAQTTDPRAVNVLAQAYQSGDSATRAVAAEGLVRILPSLVATDARHITPAGMTALLSILNRRHLDLKLVLAVLGALRQIGDARAIPVVEKLRTMPRPVNAIGSRLDRWFAIGITAALKRVTDAADECLPYLRRRADNERQRMTLLRPAERPADDGAVLLRPAAGVSGSNAQVLVRPACSPPEAEA